MRKGRRPDSLHPCVDGLPRMVVAMRLPAAAREGLVEDRESLDFRHLEQAPSDRFLSRPRRSAELKRQQPLAAILNAIVVRFDDAERTAVANFNKAPARDRETDPRPGHLESVDHTRAYLA